MRAFGSETKGHAIVEYFWKFKITMFIDLFEVSDFNNVVERVW